MMRLLWSCNRVQTKHNIAYCRPDYLVVCFYFASRAIEGITVGRISGHSLHLWTQQCIVNCIHKQRITLQNVSPRGAEGKDEGIIKSIGYEDCRRLVNTLNVHMTLFLWLRRTRIGNANVTPFSNFMTSFSFLLPKVPHHHSWSWMTPSPCHPRQSIEARVF